jgi:hypothetical protein
MSVYVSNLLTATAASVEGDPTPTRTWQWLRNGAEISGATADTYNAQEADIGANLAVRQIETNVRGQALATSALVGPVLAFSPHILFAAGEQGAWYDPSDLTTLFQDSVGTTPVTTPGQSVGLMLDKSQGLVLGPELVTNGDFSSGTTTGWTAGTNVTLSVVDGDLRIQRGAAINQNNSTPVTTVAGRTYQISWQYKGRSPGSNQFTDFRVGTTIGGVDLFRQQDSSASEFLQQTYTGYFIAAGASTFVTIVLRDGVSGDWVQVDNVSVKLLAGNHATQSNAAQRPTYGVVPATGRRNLLTFTEQFDNAAWTKTNATVTANAAVAPDGTTTADKVIATAVSGQHHVSQSITTAAVQCTYTVYAKADGYDWLWFNTTGSGAVVNDLCWFDVANGVTGTAQTNATTSIEDVGNGWYRCTCVWAAFAAGSVSIWAAVSETDNQSGNWVGDGTSGIFVWGAQLEVGSTATDYQRVGTAFDVTEAGVASRSYLSFDGTDDGMLTGNIVPGTDKAQVFAGVRKLSDAAIGALVGTTAAPTLNPAIEVLAPLNVTGDYRWQSSGTNPVSVLAPGFVAPITNVVTGLGDIAADTAIIRVNGTQAASTASDQGTGNYATGPLYIGRRGGIVFPFNGQIFGLILRFGTNLSAATVTQTETWLANRVAPTVVIP